MRRSKYAAGIVDDILGTGERHPDGGGAMSDRKASFRAEEHGRQEGFRQISATISSRGKAPVDELGQQYGHMLALG